MMRLRVLGLTIGLASMVVFFVHAQDGPDPRAIIRKAIAAHGGADKLKKFGASVSQFKGHMELAGMDLPITGESSFQKPDKIKNSVTIEINGMKVPVIVVYDGKKMWVSTNGKTMEVKDADSLREMRESLQAEGAGSLVGLLDKSYELSIIGDVNVKGKDTIGVRVSKKGQRDISIFFDKKSHLAVKTEMRVHDQAAGQEITQEKFVTAFRDVDGIKAASKVLIHKDGKFFMDIEITQTKMFERLGDDAFQMP